MRLRLAAVCVSLLISLVCVGDTGTVLILHTNDVHDHLRAGYDGVGGMPYVSGYIKGVRAERKDTLVLDAGDVMEKGDMLPFETESAVTYESMGKIGYGAATVGNHDLDHGVARLKQCEALVPGMTFLCLNYLKKDGTPYFAPSKVVDVGKVKVGLMGLTVPKGGEFLDEEATGRALALEAERLKPQVHLLVAVCHASSKVCAKLSDLAPDVQVFVSGHSHEVLLKPVRVEKTGALIVQAGNYARYVGRLDLVVDLDTKKIVQSDGSLVEMRHDSVPCDEVMLAWVKQREQEVCPQASRVIGHCEKALDSSGAARLAAAALRQKAGVEIGFCHPNSVIRSGLPQGDVDVNALFLTGGQRGRDLVTTNLTGKEIEDYLDDLMTFGKGQTTWSGFEAALEFDATRKEWEAHTSLDTQRTYRVVLPALEWNARFKKVIEKRAAKEGASATVASREVTECPFSFTEALVAYVEPLAQEKVTLDAHAEKLAHRMTLKRVGLVRH